MFRIPGLRLFLVCSALFVMAKAGSAQVKLTSTAWMYQPLVPSGLTGVTAAEIVGTVLSR